MAGRGGALVATSRSGVQGRELLKEDFRESDLRGPDKGIPKILWSFFRVFDGSFGVEGREVFSLGCAGAGAATSGAAARRALGVGGMMVVFVAVVVVESGRLAGLILILSPRVFSRIEALDCREWEP